MSAASIKSSASLPTDLASHLSNPRTPWLVSRSLFERVKKQFESDSASGKKFSVVPIQPEDPEYDFVLCYFSHSKPPKYGIKRITCIHNPDQTRMFESSFAGMEAAAKIFLPSWDKEPPIAQRARTIERWRASVDPFSPIHIPSTKRVDVFKSVKVVPLWHGTRPSRQFAKLALPILANTT